MKTSLKRLLLLPKLAIKPYGICIALILLMVCTYPADAQKRDIDSLTKALRNNTQNDTNKVITLNKLAFISFTTNVPDLKKYGTEALNLSLQLKYVSGQAFAYKNIGLYYLASKTDPIALDYFDKSYRLFSSLHDELNSAKVLNNIGYYYGLIKDNDEELKYMLKAYDGVKNSRDELVKINILGNIGNTYEIKNNLVEARRYYNRELSLAQHDGLQSGRVISYINLASVSLKEKHYKAALTYCDMVTAIKRTSDNFRPRDIALLYSVQGKLYFKLKQYGKARQVFMMSSSIEKSMRNAEYKSQNYYNLYLLDSVKGDYRAALKNFIDYSRLEDSLVNENKNQWVALYRIRFDSEKRLNDYQHLMIEGTENKAIISQQHTTQIILMIGLMIFLGGVVYLFSINNQVKAKSEIINNQNHILENNNMVKDKLFSVISHDLRSPITQVVGLLNLWEAGELSQEEMSVLTPTVKSSILHTLELLDNLLIWSKNQLHGFNYNPSDFDLRQLTAENIRDLDGLVRKKFLSVDNRITAGTMVWADMEMIKIVLRNLLSNAIKFTPDNGSIYITSETKDGFIIICVEDTGIGIKEGDQAKIFSFTSHTTLGTANEKGTGIGLKICRDFIELNNGRIWMESEENIGSKFYVSIPLKNATA